LRDKINEAILRSGTRIQYSVFAVVATPLILAELHRDLTTLTRGDRAHVVVFDVGGTDISGSRVVEYGSPLTGNGSVVEHMSVPDVWVF
jgi:CRISPR-associated endonuclease Cas2